MTKLSNWRTFVLSVSEKGFAVAFWHHLSLCLFIIVADVLSPKSCDEWVDVIMGAMPSQITSLTIVYSTVYSGADQRKHQINGWVKHGGGGCQDLDQRKHQSSASLTFVRGIHRWPVNSPHKGPVTRKMFPFDDVIMTCLVFDLVWRDLTRPTPDNGQPWLTDYREGIACAMSIEH